MIKKKVRINFIIFSLKEHFLSVIFVLFAVGLVAFSKDNLEASKEGLSLWVSSVVPALLPFFIACELLSHTEIIPYLGKKLRMYYASFI